MNEEQKKPEEVAAPAQYVEDPMKNSLIEALLTVAPAAIGFAAGGQGGAAIGSDIGLRMAAGREGARGQAASQYRHSQELLAKQKLQEKELGLKEKQLAQEGEYKKGQLDLGKKSLAQKEKERADELALKQQALEQKMAQGGQGKIITGDMTRVLADIDAAEADMSSLAAAVEANQSIMGPIAGRIVGMNPYSTEAKALDAKMKIAAQNIAKSLEGGKLSDQDILRYREMLPNITDTPEVAKSKIAGVNALLKQRRESQLGVLRKSGYNVGGFEQVASQPQAAPQGGGVSSFAQRLDQMQIGPASAVASPEEPDWNSMSEEDLQKYLGR